jgi:hypothetical protein
MMAEGRDFTAELFPNAQTPEQWRQTLGLDALEARHGLPQGILTAVLRHESNGDPDTANVSSGAAGLFQFMPDTARAYRIDPFNPQQAAPAAAQELRTLYQKYDGDVEKTLAAWNWGQGRVDRYGVAQAPAETKSFIQLVRSGLSPASAAAAPAGRDLTQELFGDRGPGSPTSAAVATPGRDFSQELFGDRGPGRLTPAEPLPTVRPNPDPSQPATLEYPGASPTASTTSQRSPESDLTITIEKESPIRPAVTPAMGDEEILRTIGVDPALVMQSRYYQPGMFGKQLITPGSPGETLTRSFVGDVMHGVRQPLDAGAQLLTRGLAKIGLTSPADVALTDAIIKLKEHEYQQTSRPTTVDLPLVGQTNVGSLAGTMLVPIPGTRGVLPAGSSAVGRTASGTVNGVIAGTVAGMAQPVSEPGTPGTPNDTFWQQKREQGEQGATVGAVTGATTSTAGAVGNKVVNAATNWSPRYSQIEEALKAATGADGTVNQRIFTAMLNIAPGVKGEAKWEVDGFKRLLEHIQAAPTTIKNATIVAGLAGSILPTWVTATEGGILGVAKLLTGTTWGRNWLVAASDLKAGSPAMQRHVATLVDTLPRLVATETAQPSPNP